MGNESSLKKNIMRVFSANFIATLVGFAKILSIDAYAIYHTYTLYLGYIAILHLGFPSGMVINYAGKSYSSIDKKQYKSEVKLLLIVLSFFTFLFFLYSIIARDIMLMLVALSIIPVCWVGSYKALLQAWNDFKAYTRINIFVAIAVPVLALIYYLVTRELQGHIYALFYLGVYTVTAIFSLGKTVKSLSGVKSEKLISKHNLKTEKTGATIVVGNYINTLFASADKQFVSWFFTNTEFAYYSFAMSMQAIMSVLITAIAQPLFPAMAQNRFSDREYDNIKKMLFVFGSFSGCAYFAISVLVKWFIPKYMESLSVAAPYFAVFPAMAVIQCLYINLYKIKGKIKTYVFTLLSVLGIAIILNLAMIKLVDHYTGIAIATVATYYIWMLIGVFQFEDIKIDVWDLLYLSLYFGAYLVCTNYLSDIVGFFVYGMIMVGLALIFYKRVIIHFLFGGKRQ